jgi:hypothetical protein
VIKRSKRSKPPSVPRSEPRIQHLSELSMMYEGEINEIQIRPPDISEHGMFVNTSTQFPEGSVVNLRFRLTQSNIEVQTRGEVRYCLSGIGIGVEFIGIGRDSVLAINNEILALSRTRRSRR